MTSKVSGHTYLAIVPKYLHCKHRRPFTKRRTIFQSTDHEKIFAKNVSLAEMQGSASGSNVRYMQRENIRSSKKDMNKAVKVIIMPDVCR
jgi:hypothetical protein